MKAVILAAGMGSRLAPLTNDRPKPMVAVGGKALVVRALERLSDAGLPDRDIIVVGGYRMDVLERGIRDAGYAPTLVANPHYSDWNSFNSLLVAREAVGDAPFLSLEGDVLFDGDLLPRLLLAPGEGLLATELKPDCDAEAMKVESRGRRVVALSKGMDPRVACGEFIGLARIGAALAPRVFAQLEQFVATGDTDRYYDDAYDRIARVDDSVFETLDVSDCLAVEIDDAFDLARAEALLDYHQARAGAA